MTRLTWPLWSLILATLFLGACAQEDNTVSEDADYDEPPPLLPGEVEIFSDLECPNGMYADPDRLSSPNTKVCIEARLNCKPGVEWKSQCNTCKCSQGARSLGFIECSREDCADYVEKDQDFGNSNLCGDGANDCPAGCGFVRRDSNCIYCQCGEDEEEEEEEEDEEDDDVE